MSLNRNEITTLASVCRALVEDLQKPVAIADTSTFLPVFADLKRVAKAIASRTALATLVNRYFEETNTSSEGLGNHKPEGKSPKLTEN